MSPWTPTVLQCTTRRTPARGGRLDDLPHGGRVHRAIGVVRQARLPVDRGDVVDDVDARGRGGEGRRIAQIARRQLDARPRQRRRRRAVGPDQARTRYRRAPPARAPGGRR